MMRRWIVALLLVLCLAPALQAEPETRLIDDFENGLSSGWTTKVFAGETRYRVVSSPSGSYLQADSKAAASGLVYEIDFDPLDYPYLSWRWKVSGSIAAGDERQKSGDDYAARLYVVFPHWFFPKTRTLNYIWANHLPKGDILPNAYTGNAMMIAVESGDEFAGTWVDVRRNLVEDYRRAFGEDPPRAGAIAIMTDTDNTGGEARAWYDDLVIRRQPQTSGD